MTTNILLVVLIVMVMMTNGPSLVKVERLLEEVRNLLKEIRKEVSR